MPNAQVWPFCSIAGLIHNSNPVHVLLFVSSSACYHCVYVDFLRASRLPPISQEHAARWKLLIGMNECVIMS